MLRRDYGSFFIVKMEDMIRLIKLPVPPSRSLAHTCLYVLEGEAVISVGTSRYKVKKNEFLFVPAGSVFSFDNHDKNKGFLIHFHNNLLVGKINRPQLLKEYEFLQVWGNPYIQLGTETSAYVKHICKRLYSHYLQYGLQEKEIIHAYLVVLLTEINRVYKPVKNKGQLSAIHLTNKFKELVFSSSKRLQRVTEYAEKLHVSPNHLNKSVKAVTGKSPTRWIDEAIVLEAKVLLYQSHLSMGQITEEIGLQDQSYFSRLFKKYEGMSPMDFRKMIEKS